MVRAFSRGGSKAALSTVRACQNHRRHTFIHSQWRARARRVLCARLCARVSLPLTSNLDEVTELDLSDSRTAGRLFSKSGFH